MSSGVDSNGDVDEDTALNPFNNVFVIFNVAAGELGRTSMPLPLAKALSICINIKKKWSQYNLIVKIS